MLFKRGFVMTIVHPHVSKTCRLNIILYQICQYCIVHGNWTCNTIIVCLFNLELYFSCDNTFLTLKLSMLIVHLTKNLSFSSTFNSTSVNLAHDVSYSLSFDSINMHVCLDISPDCVVFSVVVMCHLSVLFFLQFRCIVPPVVCVDLHVALL